MNRDRRTTTVALMALVLLCGGIGWAQDVLPASVFVETNPIGASLRLDDQPRSEKTPLLLRGLKPGAHTLVVFKEGYAASTLTVNVAKDKVAVLQISLTPDSVTLAFPNVPTLDFAGAQSNAVGNQFRLKAGRYDLATQGSTVRAKPVFGDEALLTAAPWMALGLFTAASAVTAFDVHQYLASQTFPSAATPTLWVALVGDLIWYWALADREARWHKENAPALEPLNEKAEFPGPLEARAEALQQDGDLDGAAVLFAQLVREYPDAAEVPGAWFRLARIHNLKGERELARGEYRLVAEVLQASAWYDRAHKALADLAAADGSLTDALYHLGQMTFADDFFDKSDINAEIQRLTKLQEAPHAP